MKVRYKIIQLLIAASILSSCGTVGTRISGEYIFNPEDNMGLVAVSSSIIDNCGKVGGMHSYIRKMNETYGGSPLIARNFLMSPDFDTPYGHFFVFELPPGQYTITGASVTGFSLGLKYSHKDSGISFVVKPDTTTYVGEVEYTVSKGCGYYTSRLKNSWKRDRKLFIERVPNINPDSVKLQILND